MQKERTMGSLPRDDKAANWDALLDVPHGDVDDLRSAQLAWLRSQQPAPGVTVWTALEIAAIALARSASDDRDGLQIVVNDLQRAFYEMALGLFDNLQSQKRAT
jgi:hypothetical protein